jgi:hypothetical protein
VDVLCVGEAWHEDGCEQEACAHESQCTVIATRSMSAEPRKQQIPPLPFDSLHSLRVRSDDKLCQ